MGFQLNATPAAEVTISGAVTTAVPTVPTGATAITYAESRDDVTSHETFYTVTGGKTLFISSMTISGNVAARMQVSDAGSGAITGHNIAATNSTLIHHLGAGIPVTIMFNPPIEFATTVTGAAASSMNLHIAFTGWEI